MQNLKPEVSRCWYFNLVQGSIEMVRGALFGDVHFKLSFSPL